ncbi:hypothetical protein BLNAU_17534 [Blattamonas nauphoetae]|uniref:Uncharacterized protein n=1 Tax=Blattamonas nauphoetae TaxID=2049346 RepID=A0ABQ9X9F7_9EUKA|nr:hypothetical protein BLNAU_17534 [Blattamonas nauphoetae]
MKKQKKPRTPHQKAIVREMAKSEYFGMSRAERVVRVEKNLRLKKGIVNRVAKVDSSAVKRARRAIAENRDCGVNGRPCPGF